MEKETLCKTEHNVGIITYHGADNYGSVLQAYALMKTVNSVPNVKCNIINYVSKAQKEMYGVFFSSNSINNNLKNLYILLFQRKIRIRKKESFLFFRKKYLNLFPEKVSDSVLEIDIDNYDALICGSDQVWNIRIKDYSDIYMLSGFKNVKKMSYAASMGGLNLHLSEKEQKQIADNLKNFSGVSVRETIASDMLSKSGISEAEILIDPTFLLSVDEWKEIMTDRAIAGDYIFFYSVDYNEDSIKIARWFGKEFNLPVVIMFTSWRSYFICKDGICWAGKTGVGDFLSLVFYATLVISGSFHGTAFSLIFNKPFFRIQKIKKGELLNDDRIHTLFDKLGVKEREITIQNYKDASSKVAEIDYRQINRMILHEKDTALDYLNRILINT
ncbi:polysaccharide pyruvyl transferase family protein [Acetobacterium wieringae]|uniref:polysaccharide pyruvyl transferase family protein n=1 Tax=Acetobacterium wieringae TaxID=52694 RepID=UPI0026ECE766|nr:polysaccharide pyruvyl transferase family protein [Acetobacterium wieringae]